MHTYHKIQLRYLCMHLIAVVQLWIVRKDERKNNKIPQREATGIFRKNFNSRNDLSFKLSSHPERIKIPRPVYVR